MMAACSPSTSVSAARNSASSIRLPWITVFNELRVILNTAAPQGCVLSPLLYSVFTYDCMARNDSNTIIKFVDDTTVVGLITDNDKTAYREEVRNLAMWCQDNNLSLNVIKTKEMIVSPQPHSHRRGCGGAD